MSVEGSDYAAASSKDHCSQKDCYCQECKWLMQALWSFERQLRDQVDQHSLELAYLGKNYPEAAARSEARFLSVMAVLQEARDAALDLLAKHQQLEHS